jgi:hypothetical protein
VRPTRHSFKWIVALLIVAGLGTVQLSACAETPAEGEGEEPASVEPIKGTDYNTIVLSGRAAERVGIKTAKVREQNGHKVIPFDAVSYTPGGGTFTYTSTEELTFVRRPITVRTVKNDEAILSHGPPVGTQVVTVGNAELFGAEYEFEPE